MIAPGPEESSEVPARADPASGREWLRVSLVLLAALGVRLIYFRLNEGQNPLFYAPIMDGRYHHSWATALVTGVDDFWSDRVFFRAPLYPYLLALVYRLSESSIAWMILGQHLLGVGSVGLVYSLTRRFFRPTVALAAAALAALHWPSIYFEGELLIVTLIVFLDLLALLLLVTSLRKARPSWFLASGLVLGISALARPSVLIFLPFLPLAFYLQHSARDRAARGKWRLLLAYPAAVYFGALVVIAPVLVRNYTVGKDFVPISSQAGVNFYIGNNPQSDGVTAVVPGTRPTWWGGRVDSIRMAEEDLGRELLPSEVSNYFFRKGLAFYRSAPGDALQLLSKKFYLFWAGGERSNNKHIYFFWRHFGLAGIPLPGFWLVGPLALFGGVLLWRRREIRLLHVFVGSYMLGVVAFFINARFRLPVVPVMMSFAAYGLFHALRVLQTRGPGAWKPLLGLAVCTLFIDLDFVGFDRDSGTFDAVSYHTLGTAYIETGNSEQAIQALEAALAAEKKRPSLAFALEARDLDLQLAKLYLESERRQEAVHLLEGIDGSDWIAVEAKFLLADFQLGKKDLDGAVQLYLDVLAMPNKSAMFEKLARDEREAGGRRRTRAMFKALAEFKRDDPEARDTSEHSPGD